MSNKQHEIFLEDIEVAQEDLRDWQDGLEKARRDYWDAAHWMEKMEENVRLAEKRLQDLKDQIGKF